MVYGIGARALGEQLCVGEEEAAVFMETFKARYTGKACRERGAEGQTFISYAEIR